ncbi:restriction endonuclease subunit S [Pseudomonadales bacterium]|nr:restriction endonuclease subunit S [Pseudomonadales bacterium]
MSSAVPDGWEIKPLGEMTDVINGRAYKLTEWEDFGVPVIRLQNLTQKGGSFYYSNLKLPEKQYCHHGDLLFMWSASFGPYIWWGNKAIFHYHIWKMIPQETKLNKTFLYFYLSQKTQEWKINTSGMAMQHLTKSGIESQELITPPLPEQKKIASILTSVDEVIENTQKQIDKLQDLKKATMNELLTKGIGHTEFKDSELGRIPKSWEVKCIDDVIKFSGGAQPPRSSFIFTPREGYVRLLQIRDYKSDRFATYIPEKLSRRNCNEDDVLIGRYGPPIFQILRGKSGSYNVALIKSEPRNDSLLKGYMYHFLTRADLFHLIDSLSQRTSGQTGIDLGALKSFGFPFPPIEEQHRILEILDHMNASIKRLCNKLSQTQSLKKSLMQDLLTGKVRVTVN